MIYEKKQGFFLCTAALRSLIHYTRCNENKPSFNSVQRVKNVFAPVDIAEYSHFQVTEQNSCHHKPSRSLNRDSDHSRKKERSWHQGPPGVGLAGQAIGNGIAAKRAKDAEGRYNDQAQRYEAELAEAKANRPEISNPYGEMTNAFENIQNPFASMTNTYANLGVATQAAEFQAEQADIALANSLDTMMKTGMGSGPSMA